MQFILFQEWIVLIWDESLQLLSEGAFLFIKKKQAMYYAERNEAAGSVALLHNGVMATAFLY